MTRAALWSGAIALAFGSFIAVTHKTVIERDTSAIDRAVLTWMSHLRTPSLTEVMIDVTALGSPTLIIVFSVVALFILLALRDRRGALYLAISSTGAWLWTAVTKDIVERRRPTEVEHLVKVSGFSYPSGHSLAAAALYLSLALIADSLLRKPSAKAALAAGAFVLMAMVAVSRVYLGVHYPSDVVSGVSLGAAWALIVAAVFSIAASHRAGAAGGR
jgi:undecaprenyl-diphosphatase